MRVVGIRRPLPARLSPNGKLAGRYVVESASRRIDEGLRDEVLEFPGCKELRQLIRIQRRAHVKPVVGAEGNRGIPRTGQRAKLVCVVLDDVSRHLHEGTGIDEYVDDARKALDLPRRDAKNLETVVGAEFYGSSDLQGAVVANGRTVKGLQVLGANVQMRCDVQIENLPNAPVVLQYQMNVGAETAAYLK